MAKMVTTYRVELSDGRTFEGRILPLDLVTTERQMGGVNERNTLEFTLRAGMVSLGRQHGVEFASFEAFLEALEDWEENTNGQGKEEAPSEAAPSQPSPTDSAPAPATSTPS